MNAHAPLVHYNAACMALAAAKSTDEVKDWRDKAEAMRAYAHQSKNRQLEIDAAEIRIRAERLLGELLIEQKATIGLNTGAAGIGTSAVPKENRTPTLSDIGVDKKLSSHAQKVAAIPVAEFEGIVGQWRDQRLERGVYGYRRADFRMDVYATTAPASPFLLAQRHARPVPVFREEYRASGHERGHQRLASNAPSAQIPVLCLQALDGGKAHARRGGKVRLRHSDQRAGRLDLTN